MKPKKNKRAVTRDMAKKIILNTEPDLAKEIVDRYTDSELKEWMTLLKFKTDF